MSPRRALAPLALPVPRALLAPWALPAGRALLAPRVFPTWRALPALLTLALALGAGLFAVGAHAAEGDGGATWRLEQPLPPALPDGQQAATPIGLGKIGDIEFWAPNRGLLITAGNPPTIPPGVWAYNGVAWHELSTVCGASDGRIAWAGPDEFWTISDGRPGQASIEGTPPLEDNTLCHFSDGQVVGSYASLAFLPNSYQAMHGAACLSPEDCWFAGDPLPEGQVGAFHLHWDGHSLTAEPNPQGHAVEDLRSFDGKLYESVRLNDGDLLSEPELPTEPSDLHLIEPNGVQPRFISLLPGVPLYSEGEFPEALDFLHLGADAQALWGAADPVVPTPEGSTQGQVTVLRYAQGQWSQLLGPTTEPEGHNPFTTETEEGPHGGGANEAVASLAAQPPSEAERAVESESAWLTLDSRLNSGEEPLAYAHLARLASDGMISERQTLPSEQETLEGIGPKGAAGKIACPAPEDCWMATSQGWLFHLAPPDERRLPEDTDPAFSEPDHLPPAGRRHPGGGPRRAAGRRLRADRRAPSLRHPHRAAPGDERIEGRGPAVLGHSQPARPRQHARTALPPRGAGARAPARQAPQAPGREHPDAHPGGGQPHAPVASGP